MLEWYGIRGGTLDWIKCFLTDRAQRVVLGGTESLPKPVLSGERGLGGGKEISTHS